MTEQNILVLGIGNILWADEGFGVRAVEELNKRFIFPENVHVLDGGTQGLYLVHHVEAADKMIVFDCIDYGLEPGTMKLVHNDEVPKFTGAKKMSLHQTGFQEVLSAADLLGRYPEELMLIGVQPLDDEEWCGTLSAPVRSQMEPSLTAALEKLAEWGVTPVERTAEACGLTDDATLTNGLDLATYDQGRPDLERSLFNEDH